MMKPATMTTHTPPRADAPPGTRWSTGGSTLPLDPGTGGGSVARRCAGDGAGAGWAVASVGFGNVTGRVGRAETLSAVAIPLSKTNCSPPAADAAGSSPPRPRKRSKTRCRCSGMAVLVGVGLMLLSLGAWTSSGLPVASLYWLTRAAAVCVFSFWGPLAVSSADQIRTSSESNNQSL